MLEQIPLLDDGQPYEAFIEYDFEFVHKVSVTLRASGFCIVGCW